jgi:hypothetical protein
MIDPRTTNIIGQRVLIARRSTTPAERELLGRGIVRVIDYQGGGFAFLLEAVGTIDRFGVGDGGLFEVTTANETVEVVVDCKIIAPGAQHVLEKALVSAEHPLMCAEVPISDLRVALEMHRSNCNQPRCPILEVMDDLTRTREGLP